MSTQIPLSILDLAPIVEGSDAATALRNSVALARHAEGLGYRRFWVAEHHNMDGVASSATAVLIGQIAQATERIRVGSGGIMLPNHAPLTIAEQFGTLATLFPGRIDLGLGRAPGTDGPTMRALRRHLSSAAEDRFPEDVLELQAYLGPAREGQVVRAIPGQGTEVPIWLLGSSLYSAQLAAYLGLPFAFASHFAPELLMQALELYRAQYRPSARHPEPRAMVGLNVIVADSDEQARHLFTSIQQRFLGMQRGQRGPLPRPVEDMEPLWNPAEKAGVARMLAESVVGSPATVRAGLQATLERTGADEFIVASAVHDFGARLRSYELLAGQAGGAASA
ncbi:LLM class flavin-dependent oxidoreductase [Roseateles sp. DAIF2]|uniref:LLM class flavin-dependent oxidoreductase n=1 Tax=Roseateles sp. DAIF2 TaxID=2714952 RepID=UPI0018A31395|nr:LLM class flavin-dependent oxidoreductase [Roseateles sp. DAIF2]QPF73746.1 LLM class flavin-dependent oxidoreductase [Roseateles sp. DAIF2]